MEESLFKPRKKIIEHRDSGRERKIEETNGIDLEYCKGFREFLLKVFKEANLSANQNKLDYLLEDPKVISAKGGYSPYLLGTYFDLADGVNGHHAERIKIDEDLFDKFYGKVKNKKEVDMAFKEKVKLDVILKYIENENDIAKRNILMLIAQIIDQDSIPKIENEVEIKFYEGNDTPGACRNAEKHMLAFLSGKHEDQLGYRQQMGYINLILDEKGEPVMVEKMNLGDSNSCLSLRPVRMGGVLIPAGAMFGSEPKERFSKKDKKLGEVINLFEKRNKKGALNFITTLKDYEGFEFLRMSLISLPEDLKPKIGSRYYNFLRNEESYINYDWITADVIFEYAKSRINEARGIAGQPKIE